MGHSGKALQLSLIGHQRGELQDSLIPKRGCGRHVNLIKSPQR